MSNTALTCCFVSGDSLKGPNAILLEYPDSGMKCPAPCTRLRSSEAVAVGHDDPTELSKAGIVAGAISRGRRKSAIVWSVKPGGGVVHVSTAQLRSSPSQGRNSIESISSRNNGKKKRETKRYVNQENYKPNRMPMSCRPPTASPRPALHTGKADSDALRHSLGLWIMQVATHPSGSTCERESLFTFTYQDSTSKVGRQISWPCLLRTSAIKARQTVTIHGVCAIGRGRLRSEQLCTRYASLISPRLLGRASTMSSCTCSRNKKDQRIAISNVFVGRLISRRLMLPAQTSYCTPCQRSLKTTASCVCCPSMRGF